MKTPEKEDKAISLKTVEDLKFAFRLYDADHSGIISKKEAAIAYKNLGNSIGPKEM